MAEKSNLYISREQWEQLTAEDKDKIIRIIMNERIQRENPADNSVKPRKTFYTMYGKRIIDILVSGAALFVTAPVNAVIMVITYFDVGSPVLFRQKRIGKNEKFFYLCKFRNMTNDTNERGELLPPSKRVTKWGKFVRSTSLDELLNFWSILKGDMSIIGPRPMPEQYLERMSRRHRQRHLVRPGLECPFHSRKFASGGWHGRFENDIWYVENASFSTDLKMLALLVKKVFSRAERCESADGTVGEFIGYNRKGFAIDEYKIPARYLKYVKS